MEDRRKIIDEFARELDAIAGENLRALFLYGSAVTGGFVDKKSDYNFVIVAEPVEIAFLDRVSTRARAWRKQRIPVPLIFTPPFVDRARDAYPLEFLSMLSGYELLRGADVLHEMAIARQDVRLQCERELRATTLHLRQAYVQFGRSFREMRAILGSAQPKLMAIFRGLLYLSEGPWNLHGPELTSAVRERLELPARLLALLSRIRHDVTVSSSETTELVHGLIPELERWTGLTDKL
ncbi:MAG: hypothetical protein KC729_19455 [Candidatus Eisenbacteria bacterium]|uniref:Nucleotidyltransferase domain-containing protein n=1 Tax=Eiseniibacteriota bacterium TaxID=2212470 RepID=A0A956M260_UNCEI|nr:hypothetical protein [Candidatus Eisenbacteria bacterium]